jgi:hypothetical protein
VFDSLLVSELRDVVVDLEDFDPGRVLAVVDDVKGARVGPEVDAEIVEGGCLGWGKSFYLKRFESTVIGVVV